MSQREKDQNQEKYDSVPSIQFDEENLKEVVKTLMFFMHLH